MTIVIVRKDKDEARRSGVSGPGKRVERPSGEVLLGTRRDYQGLDGHVVEI